MKIIELNGKHYIECSVVMLQAKNTQIDNKNQLFLATQDKRTHYPLRISGVPNSPISYRKECIKQYLYFLSSEEIKEEDWILNINTNSVTQHTGHGSMEWWNKIIATTEIELGTLEYSKRCMKSYFYHLPQPSPKFVKAYIEAFNKGEKIEKVLVEYKVIENWKHPEFVGTNNILKLNSSNEITIKKVKSSWTREDVVDLCKKAYREGAAYSIGSHDNFKQIHLTEDEWLKENL
jgi:hypothetical protein